MNKINELVKLQKANGEETEFYPTTQKMVNTIAEYLNKNCSKNITKILDIGCGNGCFFDKLDKADCYYDSNAEWKSEKRNRKIHRPDRYGIEKSLYLLNSLRDDVTVLGTNFYQNNIIDKCVDLIFSNPPYSDFENWVCKILKEAYSPYIVLVIPSRWKNNKTILNIMKERNYSYDIIGSDDFLDAERKARAKIDMVFVRPQTVHLGKENYEGSIKNPFDYWFENTFKINAEKEQTYSYEENEIKKEHIKSQIVEEKNTAEVLVNLYNRDMEKLYENYKALEKLSPSLLNELNVNIEGLKKGIKEKIEGLKRLYWNELFDHYDKITKRLTSKKRREILQKLGENINIDFTEENIYQLTFWIIKNANRLFDEQLKDYFFTLCNSDNIRMYKSNKRFNEDDWRYIKEASNRCSGYRNEGREKIKNVCLDYRIVTTGNSNFEYSWSLNRPGDRLTKECLDFVFDTQIIANNLGFNISINEKEIDSNFDVMLNDKVFINFKLYKNGNRHLKFDPLFMKKLNVEMARINGWIRDKREAEIELDMTDTEVEKCWKNNYTINVSNGLKLLGMAS